MDDQAANPIIIVLMFIARFAIPLMIMLGVSYLLKKLGLIKEPPPPPNNRNHNDVSENGTLPNGTEGDLAHGKR
jgi:hypothetical protein